MIRVLRVYGVVRGPGAAEGIFEGDVRREPWSEYGDREEGSVGEV